MRTLNTIVAATDFSSCSLSALRQAGRLASRSGADLHVLHVIEAEALDGLASAVPFSRQELQAQLTDQATERLGETVRATLDGAPVDHRVCVGHPFKTLQTTVEDLAADLLVLGAYGENGAGHGVGTFATRCARQCTTSVLLIDEAQAEAMKTVIACIDFSSQTDHIVASAAALAASDGARLVLLHVHDNPFNKVRWGIPVGDPGQYDGYVAALRGQLERIRTRIAPSHEKLTIECELRVGIDYGRSIVAHTNELDAALVVLGGKDKTRLAYALLGSTPEKVLRETASSVLIVRSPVPTRKD